MIFLQLLLTQFSLTTGFGATLNDSQPLAELEAAQNNFLAVQIHSGDAQLPQSSSHSSEPDQVPILAINILPDSTTDGMTV